MNGRGKRYFADGGEPTTMQLTATKTLSSGIVLTSRKSSSRAGAAERYYASRQAGPNCSG